MPPDGRFLIAFGEDTLEPAPAWTRIDSHPSLVASYAIDRGRQVELDRTDAGRATVEISDRDGLLDPTNSAGPYYGLIEPMLQAMIGRYNPVNDTWYTRYRGFVEELDYQFDPSQQVNKLVVSLVDLFELLSRVEMQPGTDGTIPFFGDAPPAGSEDQVYFSAENVDQRITRALMGAGITDPFRVIFSGNVELHPTVYSPGESAMTAVQEAADGEFPGVSNVYVDRFGRICFHGRFAKFSPEDVDATTDEWDFISWKAGDHTAVNADPVGTARLREFAFNRGLAMILNQGYATPKRDGKPLTAAESAGQLVRDTGSVGHFGVRPWSAQDLLTKKCLVDGADDLTETHRFAQYYVANYKQPRNRSTACGFRTMRPGTQGATKTWELLSKIDIADLVQITVASPGGGGFNLEAFYVEGVHETCRPLNGVYDDVTLAVDLSPKAYFDDVSMFPDGPA